MRLILFNRHFGIHKYVKEVTVDLKFDEIVKRPKEPNDDFLIDEFSIFLHMPKNFLPVDSLQILLCVGDKHGSTAQRHPDFFRPWGKYFDSYSLELSK